MILIRDPLFALPYRVYSITTRIKTLHATHDIHKGDLQSIFHYNKD